MRIIDITLNLDEKLLVYEGDPFFVKKPFTSVGKDGFALCQITMGTHTGTHVDAPSHFLEEGRTLKDISLNRFVGSCYVYDSASEYENKGHKRVIIKSGRLTPEQADELVEDGVKIVGTDMLSIGDDEVHKILLGGDCLILEALKLDSVRSGEYTLIAMPLKIDADGSPIRACLIDKLK